MWIVCGIMSVVFTVVNWFFSLKRSEKSLWAALSAITFTAITLLLEYRMVLNWVNMDDWSALMDVVPTMFGFLTGYVILIFLANTGALLFYKKGNK